ncbi:MAG: PqqD family protein [Candidatus Binatia bacterium]
MLNLDTRVRVCEEVAAKVIDGEAIIINLANGIYYSMDKVGGLIWDLLERGDNLAEVVDGLVMRYEVARDQARADVDKLASELLEEKLIQIETNGMARSQGEVEMQGEKLPYQSPTLNIYRDMGDLLALDPPTPGLDNIAWKDPDEKLK